MLPHDDPAPRPLLAVADLARTYHVGPTAVPALRGVSFSVARGEFVAVVGPSGSGKSTLLNLIAGVDSLDHGEVIVAGRPVHRMREAERARWRGASVGIVFQFFQMLPTLTLLANVMLPMELAGCFTPAMRRERAAALLTRVGLAEHIHKLPSRVSGGDQQRAAIARADANDPPLIFGDEPTGRQDPRSAEVCFALFQRWVAASKTMLMVTHSRELAARTARTIELADGRIVRDAGHPPWLYPRTTSGEGITQPRRQ